MAEDYTNAARFAMVLVDPDTGEPYKASFSSTTVEGDFDPTGLATEAKQDAQIVAVDGVTTRLGETLNVHVVDAERPLAVGAATGAKQDAEIARLNDIYNLLGAGIEVTETRATTPVSVQALPLPSGASTAAKQDTVIAKLNGTLSAEVTNTVPVTMANRGVTVDNAVQITNTEFAVTPKSGATFPVSGTVALSNPSLPVTGTVAVSSIGAPVPVTDNGQSLTVDGNVGVSGGTITVDNTVLPLPTGASTATLQGTGNTSLASLDAKVPTKGQKLQADSLPVVLAGDHTTIPVAVSNFPATQPVSGAVSVSNFPATQPVSGTVTATPAAPSATSSGLLAYRNTAVAATAVGVKSGSTRTYGYHFINTNTTWAYVHLYNSSAGSVTVGTTVPALTLGVPPNAVLDGAWAISVAFSTALSIASTLGPTGNTATTTPIIANLSYI